MGVSCPKEEGKEEESCLFWHSNRFSSGCFSLQSWLWSVSDWTCSTSASGAWEQRLGSSRLRWPDGVSNLHPAAVSLSLSLRWYFCECQDVRRVRLQLPWVDAHSLMSEDVFSSGRRRGDGWQASINTAGWLAGQHTAMKSRDDLSCSSVCVCSVRKHWTTTVLMKY